jgi:hypothetical protein
MVLVWVALISDIYSCDQLSCETISFLYLLVYSVHLVYFALWPFKRPPVFLEIPGSSVSFHTVTQSNTACYTFDFTNLFASSFSFCFSSSFFSLSFSRPSFLFLRLRGTFLLLLHLFFFGIFFSFFSLSFPRFLRLL